MKESLLFGLLLDINIVVTSQQVTKYIMEIYIDGKIAAIKEGSTFDYVVENRAFTGADAYTMNITFPLASCSQNMDILGLINRKDVDEGKVNFQCDIFDRDFFKSGLLTVTGITDVEVKCQFLEGRSEQNYYKALDEIYINELELGEYEDMRKQHYTPDQLLKDIDHGADFVCLPWVNNSSGNMQNAMKSIRDLGVKDDGLDEKNFEEKTSIVIGSLRSSISFRTMLHRSIFSLASLLI